MMYEVYSSLCASPRSQPTLTVKVLALPLCTFTTGIFMVPLVLEGPYKCLNLKVVNSTP